MGPIRGLKPVNAVASVSLEHLHGWPRVSDKIFVVTSDLFLLSVTQRAASRKAQTGRGFCKSKTPRK